MIQKLRKKFILINMLLVSMVLIIVFSIFCFSNYQRLQQESYGAMRQALSRRLDEPPPKLEIGGGKQHMEKPFFTTPVFCVVLEEDGSIGSVYGQNVTVSDDDLTQMVAQAMAGGGQSGILSSYGVRYMIDRSPNGTRLAFADRTNERSSMGSVLLTSFAAGFGALAAFFVISLFLARWALRPVERAWKQQQQFVADASHELKTPLTVILANMGILRAHRNDTVEEQLKWVDNTQTEAERMKQLVDDLLFLAKSDASRAPLVFSRINLSDIVWGSVLPFESLAFENGVTLNSEIMPDIFLEGHEGQIRQLVAILVDNACKYAGKQGLVTLCLYCEADKALLSVNNTGAPVPPEELSHLFERFYRADKSRARGKGGYGLGLAIAKTIVESHKGKITVQSSAEKGTTFLVELPRTK